MYATPLRALMPDPGMTLGAGGTDCSSRRLLLVDDDLPMLHTLGCYFAQRGFNVMTAATITEAKRRLLDRGDWCLIISDLHLPDGTGWEFFCWLRDRGGIRSPFLLISGATEATIYASQVNFLAKPFSINQLDSCVRSLLAGAVTLAPRS